MALFNSDSIAAIRFYKWSFKPDGAIVATVIIVASVAITDWVLKP